MNLLLDSFHFGANCAASRAKLPDPILSGSSLINFQKLPRFILFLNDSDDYDKTTNPPKCQCKPRSTIYASYIKQYEWQSIDLQYYSTGK